MALAGTLFSGYLTVYTFITNQPGCDLFFFGLPSCFYGAIMYVLVLGFSLYLIHTTKGRIPKVIAAVGLVGVLFAAFLTSYILSVASCTTLDILGMPPCVYGVAIFIIILILSIAGALRLRKD